MNIKEKLTCKICNGIFKDPIFLNCCGENMCKQHFQNLISNDTSNKFTCPFCNQENSNQKLDINTTIQSFLEIELHEFELDPKYERVLTHLRREVGNLEAVLKDPENIIYEEIGELKRQVDLKREKLKIEIDDLADDLINQLDSHKKRFMEEYKSNIQNYHDLVESSKKQLNEYEACLQLFSTKNNEKEDKYNECEKIMKIVRPSSNEAKNKLFSNISITFKPMNIHGKDLFGKLVIKVTMINFLN
jgi:DNA repair exonuclease SbcCD ATPase subunit